MEEKNAVRNNNTLSQCPFCPCCFCSEVDLQKHLKTYGTSKSEHLEKFRKDHGRLEHGFNAPE